MREIFTLSAFETSVGPFFDALLRRKAGLVLNVRLRNTNQLCGFTKQKGLEYLISRITGAGYVHDLRFAPTHELLKLYQGHLIDRNEYRKQYVMLMHSRGAGRTFQSTYGAYFSVCILGAATKKRRSYSEALVQLLTDK